MMANVYRFFLNLIVEEISTCVSSFIRMTLQSEEAKSMQLIWQQEYRRLVMT
jgi:hypothetical protein